jgi:hydrophobe/amphiphile efflux-1 (HAE1) family protein
MSLSEPFIRRPIATSLLSAALVVAGAAAFTQLPVAPLPRVDFPTISVRTALPGASAETMASAVATPLERRFGRIAGLTEMTSTSALGNTSITLQFDLDRDADSAARDVQAAINAAAAELPPNLPLKPNYKKVNPADSPILILSVKSRTLPVGEVYQQANSILAQKISQVQGVGQVFVGGAQQPAVRVQVDPAALAARGLATGDVRNAINRLTLAVPKGAISGSAQSQAITANDQLIGAAAWKDAIIAWKDGAPIRLGEVGTLIDGEENNRVAGWADGTRAVSVIIRREPGANIIDTIDRVKALLPSMARSISPAIDINVALDRSQTIRASVAEVELTLLISVLLVVLVVFLFLRSVRATLIPSVAVPISLIGTFGVIYLCGYSVNNLSLMALTISTGFVVDDAIVVTENIARYVDQGMDPVEAAVRGAREITFTIVSITVSLLAVFIPILFMGGIVGRLFREFAVTLAVAVSISGIVSLTVTPAMCARLLRPEHGQEKGWLNRVLERGFEITQQTYGVMLEWVLRHRTSVGITTIGTIALTVYLAVIAPKGLFPQQDVGMLIGFSEGPQDISFPAMKKAQLALNAIVQDDPDVEHVISYVGLGPSAGAGNTGNLFIALKPKPERKTGADQIIGRLRSRLAKVEGMRLYLQSAQDVRVGGRFARTQYQYTMQDASLEELNTWAPRMLAKLKTLPELKDVASDAQNIGLELNIKVDRETMSRVGLTMRDVDDALYDAFGQRLVATMYTQRDQYRVVLEVKPELVQGPDTLSRLYVRNQSGQPVPLSAFATITPTANLLAVNHQGQFPSVTLSFNTSPDVALGDAVEAVRRAEAEVGLPARIQASFAGTAQAYKASLASEPYLILAALLAVYIVLGMLYESYIHPVTILSTLPSAGVGALLALQLFRMDLSIMGLIGIILLIGIVKKNAIMMIDFAIELRRDHGEQPEQAIRHASLLRFRPIIMTTLAALLGALPLIFGSGAGSELRKPLGITIIGGLIVSQMLTLFTTPVTYLFLDRFSRPDVLPDGTLAGQHVPPANETTVVAPLQM